MSNIRTGRRLAFAASVALVALAGCNDHITQPGPTVGDAPSFKRSTVSDPTATWMIPTADQGLNLRSDGQYLVGSNSAYADGVCSISAKIFATTAASNSGDATINSGTGTKCIRTFTLVYPDGVSESFKSFNNLHELENTSFSISVGDTVPRVLVISPGMLSHDTSRCGSLHFGPGTLGVAGPGSDSVLVARVDASTWHVQSQPAPNDLAYCDNTGELYHMQIDFTIVSSSPLP